jgi:hypothetical protein
MSALLALLAAAQAIVAEPPPLGPEAFEARMKASSAAAQALQGHWDGTWVLSEAHGRPRFVFQITDPADGGPLAGAWREAARGGRTGWIDAIARRGGGLQLSFTPAGQGEAIVVRVEPRGARSAVGLLDAGGVRRPVRLALRP